ncbi:MAG: winged helix-turn-helix domain-containing protein [Maribacter stanieri]
MNESLSIQQARKLVLHSQRLPPVVSKGSAVDATLAVIEHLGYIQIDTISVIQRAHHHTLWSRNPRYDSAHLEQLVAEKKVYEYWSHAAAYLPMSEYRFSLYRKHAMKSGAQKHWFERDDEMIRYVMDRITAEGPLLAKDFEHKGEKLEAWQSKPAKKALEYLFMQGDLMISSRQKFQKVYSLTEQVLPTDIDDSLPSDEEYARHIITRFLTCNGLALANEFGYLLKQIKPMIRRTLDEMLSAGEVQLTKVAGNHFYVLNESLALLDKPLARRKLVILSPFDNLLIQRKRMRDLFDFDYQIECYVPAAKRIYGYFVLPVIWGGRFAARMDCKADRKTGTLHIHSMHMEAWVKDEAAFAEALNKELYHFMAFNNCDTIQRK